MWNIENQDIIVLVSVISVGCAIILNVWSSFIALTPILVLIFIIIIIIIFGWWCTYRNHTDSHNHNHQRRNIDNGRTPLHTFLPLDYLKQAGRELSVFIENLYNQIFRYSLIIVIGDRISNLYKKHFVERMAAQRRRNSYQLSAEETNTTTTEWRKNSQNSTKRLNFFDGQLSPIPRLVVTSTLRTARPGYNLNNVTPYSCTETLRDTDSRINEPAVHQQVTSTPLISSTSSSSSSSSSTSSSSSSSSSSSTSSLSSLSLALRKTENAKNNVHSLVYPSTIKTNLWKNSQSVLLENHTLSQGDNVTHSLTEQSSSPWGTSISPKMRARAGGIKTVQTVAGPLLASTRYNIDPKLYSDITSPGLTTRLTKYATEANMKLTHQSQYGTGQFPRVNLSSSPTPLINTKRGKIGMPVTVRVAPPESTTRYSPPERQQILSEICHVERINNRGPSVVQVLREISLKRHASREEEEEDVTFDLAKKQRTEGVLSADGLENGFEEITQKRVRDDSSRSEEDSSSPNKVLLFGRPAKRSKMPSCCYDILSSLSSSINVVNSSGLKRKAIDVSPNGASNDVGKHFKSLDFSGECGDGKAIVTRISHGGVTEPTKKANMTTFNESEISKPRIRSNSNLQIPEDKKSLDSITEMMIMKCLPGKEIVNDDDDAAAAAAANRCDNGNEKNGKKNFHEDRIRARGKISKFSSMPDMKFTDKLFMKAEPQNIDKLKTLIEEHGSIKPRFTTNDTDEIKKSDIVNMRQTSMKTRLKSMFDAISGKATSKINPEVVIQAEESNESSPPSELIVASLNSSTWTTNVNTSPIATSAIVPIIGKTKVTTTPAKHVTFQFNNVETTSEIIDSPTIDNTIDIEDKTKNGPNVVQEMKKIDGDTKNEKSTGNSIFQASKPSPNTIVRCTSSANETTSSVSTIFPSTSTSDDLTSIPVSSCSGSGKSKIFSTHPASLSVKSTTTMIQSSQFNCSQVSSSPTTTTSSLFGISTATMGKSISSPLPSINNTSQSIEKNFQLPVVNFSLGSSAGSISSSPKSQENESSSLVAMNSTIRTLPTPTTIPIAITKSGHFGLREASKPAYSYPGALNSPVSTSFSFGANASTPHTTEKKNFTFGTTATVVPSTKDSESPKIISGIGTSQSDGFNFSTSNKPTPTTTTNIFGAPSTSTSSLAFSSSMSTNPTLTFGSNSITTSAASKPGYSFVTSPTIAASVVTTSAPPTTLSTLSFGTTSNDAGAIPLFGVSSTTSAVTSTDNTTTTINTRPIFGASTTSTTGFVTNAANSSAFGTISSQSVASSFGSNSTIPNTFGPSKTIETIPAFGGTNTAGPVGSFAQNSTISSVSFGHVNTEGITTNPITAFGGNNFGQTKAPPAFGTNASSSFVTVPSTNLFASQPTTTAAVAFGTCVNNGGSSTSTSTSVTPIFGATSSTLAPSLTTPIPTFGASNTTTVPTFGIPSTAPPPFGATSTSSSTPSSSSSSLSSSSSSSSMVAPTSNFGTVSTAFGGNNTATSAFGGQSIVAAGTLANTNSASLAFSGAVTTAPPAFPTSLIPQFGNSGSSNQPPVFSSGNSSFTGFGASSSNVTSPFSIQPTPSTPVFGTSSTGNSTFATNNPSNNANSSFTFTQPAIQQPQQNAGFAFGGAPATSANNSSSGSAPFQFGSATPQIGGFNFTGGSSTPAINFSKDGTSGGGSFSGLTTPGTNAFNAPTTGGMFSIGTGSTAPRSRPSRRRQR